MVDWYPNGKDILFATPMTSEKRRFNKLYRVPATGGLPEVLKALEENPPVRPERPEYPVR